MNNKEVIRVLEAEAENVRLKDEKKYYDDIKLEALTQAIKVIKEHEEITEAYEATMKEVCEKEDKPNVDDRMHCTCVPYLRMEVKKYRELLERVEAEGIVEAIKKGKVGRCGFINNYEFVDMDVSAKSIVSYLRGDDEKI